MGSKYTTSKLLSGKGCNAMRNALRRRLLDLEVDAYIKLGDAAGDKQNPAVATNYYKFAKKLLIESDLTFDGKNELVREISNKTQLLFGNAVEDQLSRDLKSEEEKEAINLSKKSLRKELHEMNMERFRQGRKSTSASGGIELEIGIGGFDIFGDGRARCNGGIVTNANRCYQ